MMDDSEVILADKQSTIDEISAICNSLGKVDENDGVYMKDRDCKACLKELLRALSKDSDQKTVRSTLGSLNIIKSDLIPLMVQYCDYEEGDEDLYSVILRLCVNLTTSAQVFFENQNIPTEPEDKKLYDRLLSYLRVYKEAFASDVTVWSTLNKHLRYNTDEEVIYERLIILIRNILQISHTSTGVGFRLDAGCEIHDSCLHHMEKSGMLDTIIYIASSSELGTKYCFHLTEIIYFMLRDQNPEILVKAQPNSLKNTQDDDAKKRYAEVSARLRRERQAEKKQLVSCYKYRDASFTVQNYRSLGDAPLWIKCPTKEPIKFDGGKTDLRKAKNKKPLVSESPILNSDTNMKTSKYSYSLKLFCRRFIDKVYANYMQQIKHNLIQQKAQPEDEEYYLWALQFFTAFNRLANLKIDNISDNLSTSSLHYIQILITNYQEKIKVETKKFHQASYSLHLALRAYRELLLLIQSIDKSSDFYQTAETIQRRIFHEIEYSSLLLTMLQHYHEPKHSFHYLRDLVKTNSVFLELVQQYSSTHAPIENAPEEVTKEKPKKRKRKSELDLISANALMKYCCPHVVMAHLRVLENFKTNDNDSNLAVLKLFEGIAYGCKNEVLLFQASIFRCLLEIMDYDPSMQSHERFKALGKHLIEKFGAMANKRRWMYQELLFCKTFNDAISIEHAIDPPPVILPEEEAFGSPRNIDLADEQVEAIPEDTSPSSQPERNDSLADLLAELADSDDDDELVSGSVAENLPDADISEPPIDIPDASEDSVRTGALNDSIEAEASNHSVDAEASNHSVDAEASNDSVEADAPDDLIIADATDPTDAPVEPPLSLEEGELQM